MTHEDALGTILGERRLVTALRVVGEAGITRRVLDDQRLLRDLAAWAELEQPELGRLVDGIRSIVERAAAEPSAS